ncbi:ribose/xylose/arabinose/galactoside ABC-type transport system permease subunit [Bacillus pakistanensis]|uniref:Ribose/xylose/arabinose/galactoside ABC-type transport system permease subunit n=2 Tax=Rossellomorea pakistanensis TaxID=992288 RepID=A0ABS2N733_9BACI|nr:ribose/xylose/arabinose/galactoside ABC-type transport system permease subunit [Bacillus pakistanensis]
MTSLWLKIILCPLIIGISSLLFPNVNFTTFWQPVLIGLVLAVAGLKNDYLEKTQKLGAFLLIL